MLNRIDRQIIRILQNNVRIANKELAAMVGLAPSSCHERVKRLWDKGVLKGAHANVDAKSLGFELEALLFIELTKHERAEVDGIIEKVIGIPEVQSAFLITGQHDLVVHVIARDTAHLRNIALDRFTNQPSINRLETSIIYEKKHAIALPVST